jgi:hypothetical protein
MSEQSEKQSCNYCRKERAKSDLKEGTIFYIGRDHNGKRASLKKKGLYCADDNCHSYDQMAHEG